MDKGGYGIATIGRRPQRAHRMAYERHHGVELAPRGHPDHRQVDHACHNRSRTCPGGAACLHRRCVNPTHLVLATAGENTEASRHTPAHRNRHATECVHGHPFTAENTYRRPNGNRACRTCKRNSESRHDRRVREARGPAPHYQSHKTHCPHGHPYSGDNLRMRPDGSRACRTCQRAATTRHRARQTAA